MSGGIIRSGLPAGHDLAGREANHRDQRSLGGTLVHIFLYVEDVDSVFNRAVSAGAKPEMPVTDIFWGDRYGKLPDPFGHLWSLATPKEDVAPEEMAKRSEGCPGKDGTAGPVRGVTLGVISEPFRL